MSYTAVINPNLPNSYSAINGIYLQNDNGLSFNINVINPECQFERLETIENINEIFPNGSLIVRDTKDILTFISNNQINKIFFTFLDGKTRITYITSTSYITNAASENEENMVSINFSNLLYKTMQQTALLDLLPYQSPKVFRISDFIKEAASAIGTNARVVDETSNYMVFSPFYTSDDRIEKQLTNPLQYINYISSFATGKGSQEPRFMFWTNWDGHLVFKYFEKNVYDDPYAGNDYITSRGLRYKIYDENIENLSFPSQNNKYYKKIYYMCTDPADQFISKNYYYVRKTPKILDVDPNGITGGSGPVDAYTSDNMDKLIYHYQDEGERYNVELISSNGSNSMVPGADQLIYESQWGNYNSKLRSADVSKLTLLGQDYGSAKQYDDLLINGSCGYFQYVDNPEMWKMMFDFTQVHPNYPDINSLLDTSVDGKDTYLQKILDIRYDSFISNLTNDKARLETFRKIEKENFIMYVLCCMSKQEKCFFAKLTRYETDQTYGAGLSGGASNTTFIPFKYKWTKLNFGSEYGSTGPTGDVGSGGTAYYFNNIESWKEDPIIKGNTYQDDSWAINLNERTISKNYLPPGWIANVPQGFKFRPIGKKTGTSAGDETKGDINHIVKMCAVPISDLLLDSKQEVPSNYLGKYLYYFTAENVVDGNC